MHTLIVPWLTVQFISGPQVASFLISVTHTQSKVCVLDLKGIATSQSFYLHGGDSLRTPVESLLPPITTLLSLPSGIKASTLLFC